MIYKKINFSGTISIKNNVYILQTGLFLCSHIIVFTTEFLFFIFVTRGNVLLNKEIVYIANELKC